jgi:hypothetical protein
MELEVWQTDSEYYRDTFWETIDEWSTGTNEAAVFHESVPNHEEMLAECKRYTSWNSESSFPLASGRKRHERIFSTTSNKYEETDRVSSRYFAMPTKEDFPVIYEFLKCNEHQYFRPEISRLDPAGQIFPHTHMSSEFTEEWMFNMSLNFPDKCKFAVYPTGLIPYQAGDVYKLKVKNYHSVINESDTPRYHIMMRTKEYMQLWKKIYNE